MIQSVLNQLIIKLTPLLPRIIVWRIAGKYVAGETSEEVLSVIKILNDKEFSVTVDILGEQKSSTFGFRIGAGYAFFLGDHVAIEPTLNYRWEDINPDGSSSDYTETISSIFLGIGISAYF